MINVNADYQAANCYKTKKALTFKKGQNFYVISY
jgi:hypothetical protein